LLSLDDLRALPNLTPQQKVGLQYFDELEIKIPQDEMHVWNVTAPLPKLIIGNHFSGNRNDRSRSPSHPCWSLVRVPQICSYNSRRGALEAPEIDVLLTHPDLTDVPEDATLIKSITDKLHEAGHLTEHLLVERARYDGIAQLPVTISSETPGTRPPHRRIKFRVVPSDSFVYAQLHFTGSEAFMKHLREQAARRGYRLTPEKLEKRKKIAVEIFGVDALRFMEQDKNDTRKEGECVILDSEEDIFRFLRMKYVHPQNRNWF